LSHVCREPARGALYAAPITQNGEDADLIVLFCADSPDGRILGTRREDGYVIQKGVDPLRDGDEIAFYYKTAGQSEDVYDKWALSGAVAVTGGLTLTWERPGPECGTRLFKRDIRLGEHFGSYVSFDKEE
jgi:hypothetical protein